jgi:SAM-dependent methyltransferase
MSAPPRLFDRSLHRLRLDRAALGYGAADFLKARAAADAVERLETILRDFPLAVDLGARNGAFAAALAQSEAKGRVGALIQTDLSGRMLAGRDGARVQADEERLPFAAQSLDLVISTLALHWTNDLVGALIQIRTALKPDGLFIGALLGGQTLAELRQVLVQAEAELSDGAGLRISPFADVLDAAGLLQRAGFALPVADTDRVMVRYAHALELIRDLRAMGESNVLYDRARKPLTRAVLARAAELYRERFAGPDGRIAATFDIISMTGWAPHPDQQQPLRPGSAKMRLADALHVKERSAGDFAPLPLDGGEAGRGGDGSTRSTSDASPPSPTLPPSRGKGVRENP